MKDFHTEYAWAPDDDTGSLVPTYDRDSAQRQTELYGGAVYVREVTGWQPEGGEQR